MAIYFGRFSVLSRIDSKTKRTQSAVAASAYKACEKLRHFEVSAAAAYIAGDLLEARGKGKIHDYSKKQGVVFSEIMLPPNAPAEYADRQKLWNAVELSEKRKDAQLAREFIGALPRELSHDEQIELVREYIMMSFVTQGMIADYAIHHPDHGNDNPHVHIMLTMREVTQEGFGNKNRNWNQRSMLEGWRKGWADAQNKHLERAGYDIGRDGVDHRSYKEQGSGLIGQYHEGKDATMLRRKGVLTEVAKANEEIKAHNMAYLKEVERQVAEVTAPLKERLDQMQQQMERIKTEDRAVSLSPDLDTEFEPANTPVVLYDANMPQKQAGVPFSKEIGPETRMMDSPNLGIAVLQTDYKAYIDLAVQMYALEQSESNRLEGNRRLASQVENLLARKAHLEEVEEALSQADISPSQRKLLDNKYARAKESLQRDFAVSIDGIEDKVQSIQAEMTQSSQAHPSASSMESLKQQQQEIAVRLAEAIKQHPERVRELQGQVIDYEKNAGQYQSIHEQLVAKKAERQLREHLGLDEENNRERKRARDHSRSQDRN